MYVSATNLAWDAEHYFEQLNVDAVKEIHLAGFTEKTIDQQRVLIDSHNQPVAEPVWQLYKHLQQRFSNNIPTMIEWDSDFPPLQRLLDEVAKIKVLDQQVKERRSA